MENASKALIIAGSILLAILLISLVLYARSSVSEYQNSKVELDRVENLAKFNDQFAQYDRKDVAGYELISLANMVADYNSRYSKDGHNNEGYNPIKLQISFNNDTNRNLLSYEAGTNYLFNRNIYEQNSTKNEIKNIIDSSINSETQYGGTEVISRIAKNINSIFLKNLDSDPDKAKAQKKNAIDKFNSLLSNNGTIEELDWSDSKVDDSYKILTQNDNYKKAIYKYYEYIQFKRCIFQCIEMTYDNNTGRVSNITFNFVKLR